MVVTLLLVLGFVQYLISDLNEGLPKDKVDEVIREIKSADSLPDRFYKIYGVVWQQTNTTGIIYDWTFGDYSTNCPCLDVSSYVRMKIMSKNRITANRYILSWKLERELSQN